ncbi:hypothetical protein QBC39DRAFT_325854 [Podospora conica]|nr:hypothetical protein QBC39DRAFT_325854 [Schizothecium conicum]
MSISVYTIDLFAWESFVQTIRLILLDAFDDDRDLSRQIKTLYQTIPSLFTSILTGANELPSVDPEKNLKIEATESLKFKPLDTNVQKNINTISKLQLKVARAAKLPAKDSEIDLSFKTILTKAYEVDYARLAPSSFDKPPVVRLGRLNHIFTHKASRVIIGIQKVLADAIFIVPFKEDESKTQ